MTASFRLQPYPYDLLKKVRALADRHLGGCVDLSVGDPTDPSPLLGLSRLAEGEGAGGYPRSVGSAVLRESAARWLRRRFGVEVQPETVAACVGVKEFVGLLPRLLALREPERDTVLFPAVAYPTYEAGASLSGLRSAPVAVDEDWRMLLETISDSDARRALCLWVNYPANPTGAVGDLSAAADWGRERGVPVFSDECYIEFAWDASVENIPGRGREEEAHAAPAGKRAPGRSILEHGSEGVVAVHSLSKRSNFAGMRVGCYAGDEELVRFLSEARKHLGLMVPGPAQAAAAAVWGDDAHVEVQRERYRRRLQMISKLLEGMGLSPLMPAGGLYLWVPAPDGDAWGLTRHLAERAGVLVSPGEFFGQAGRGYVRVAAVAQDERINLALSRAGVSST